MIHRNLRMAASAAALATLCIVPLSAARAQVSVNVGVPGLYGQIDIGDVPHPDVIYNQPVVIDHGPQYVAQPQYLHVPPGQERDWKRYCNQYNACGRPVYFVKDDWYHRVYEPKHHVARADDHRGPPPGKDEHRDDHRDDDHHDDHDRR
jgi:hypothetical protein